MVAKNQKTRRDYRRLNGGVASGSITVRMYMPGLNVVVRMLALMRLKHGPAMAQTDLVDHGRIHTGAYVTPRTEYSVVVHSHHVFDIPPAGGPALYPR